MKTPFTHFLHILHFDGKRVNVVENAECFVMLQFFQRTQHGIFHRSHVAMFSEGIKTLILCIITVFTPPLELIGTEPLQAHSLLGHKP